MKISEGKPYPLGATVTEGGVNFTLFSEHASRVELCLFDELGRSEIERFDLIYTDQVWHGFVEGLQEGALYGYRVHGDYDPTNGNRFNANKLLLDPYTKKVDGEFRWCDCAFGYDTDSPQKDLKVNAVDNAQYMPKSVVVDFERIMQETDIEQTRPAKPNIPWSKTVIYETHVKGFTQLNLSVPSNLRGTYAGLAHPDVLHYIKSLGVTAIELLPVHGFIDEKFLTDQGLSNYWGYNSLHFFMPHTSYLSSGDPLEFRDMVDAVHEAGMEVILDVVYNHTAEGNELGPTLSFRGIDNKAYYCLEQHNQRFYANDTGCGNTLNLKHPRVLQMVIDSLRFWAKDMGVDGFRFDLATVLGREAHGFDAGSGFFDVLRQDPILSQCKLIAEPWDIGPGGYQLGQYPSGWSEWNDRYRDVCRQFWQGASGVLPEFARRIHGSSDFFEAAKRAPSASLNFITSHDGFTLTDLVSYNDRNNLANKEDNKDGHHTNHSFNHGVEGETDDPDILALRLRQQRNLIATLFLSQGTPMLLAGDELCRSQNGNNNAYCQDNEINWVDWSAIDENKQAIIDFTRHVATLRQQFPLLTSKKYIHKPSTESSETEVNVRWVSESGDEMNAEQWQDTSRRSVGWILEQYGQPASSDDDGASMILILFNSGDDDIHFKLPSEKSVKSWQCVLNSVVDDGIPAVSGVANDSEVLLVAKSIMLLSAEF